MKLQKYRPSAKECEAVMIELTDEGEVRRFVTKDGRRTGHPIECEGYRGAWVKWDDVELLLEELGVA